MDLAFSNLSTFEDFLNHPIILVLGYSTLIKKCKKKTRTLIYALLTMFLLFSSSLWRKLTSSPFLLSEFSCVQIWPQWISEWIGFWQHSNHSILTASHSVSLSSILSLAASQGENGNIKHHDVVTQIKLISDLNYTQKKKNPPREIKPPQEASW